MTPIPITAAEKVAKEFGYDQIVIIARQVGVGEHVTTYGVTPEHCSVAARMGDFFKHKLMGWPETVATMSRSHAIALCRTIMEKLPLGRRPDYYSNPFVPHEWVIDAVREASTWREQE